MPESSSIDTSFLQQLTGTIEKNISNELFGVSELAEEMNMSRSNLLRKVKKETNLSVSQLISQIRLKKAMELLRTGSLNVSEVSDQVGFNSTSYFIKCFREYYGYPPGEVGKKDRETETAERPEKAPGQLPLQPAPRFRQIFVIAACVAVLLAGLGFYLLRPGHDRPYIEKSIAVLPFKNESDDSSNVYLINGLMESTLTNLQKIKDLRVISRTSSEKYRNSFKSIPEMAKELNVSYFVEGSGQKIGDEILLHIQLIEGSTDKHLWARQYKREAKDIFDLQQEIASNIADEIEAVITPDEKRRIEKRPTDNLVAYDHFLKGLDFMRKPGRPNLEESVKWFKKATDSDPEFSLAYAEAVIAYYYLDIFRADKKYTTEINSLADKAVLYDPKLAESLVAKAISYIQQKNFTAAVPFLEKALEYNPNSTLVISFLTDFYHYYVPNTAKYLQYALKGVRLEAAGQDSATTSLNYLRLGNAFLQLGFLDEALVNIDRSLIYNPKNPYSIYVRIFILFAKDRNAQRTRDMLVQELSKDTTRIDIMQEIAKISYFMRDYETSYHYYKRFVDLKKSQNMEIFKGEDLRIAIVLDTMGFPEESKEYVRSYKEFAESDQTLYKHLYLTAYFAYIGDNETAIEHTRHFAKEENYLYWVLLWDVDPIMTTLTKEPEFIQLMKGVESKFWESHRKIRADLEEQGLL
jgi:TolB-like protein/AraC-like DNA-binding protein/Tfp pilus assembly protein PilF